MPFLFLKNGGQAIQGVTPLMQVMRQYKMLKKEATEFLLLFETIDEDHNGFIDFAELLAYLNWSTEEDVKQQFVLFEAFLAVEPPELVDLKHATVRTKFESLASRRANSKRALRLKYIEFFVAVYNFNTLDQRGIVRFAFDMLDSNHSGRLQRSEVEEVVRRFLNTAEKKLASKVNQLMFFLDEDGDGDVGFEEFWRLHTRLSLLMFPVFKLQVSLRKKIIGEAFWKKAAKRRAKAEAEPIETYKWVLEGCVEPKGSTGDSVDDRAAPEKDEGDAAGEAEEEAKEDDENEEKDEEPPLSLEEAEDLIAQTEDEVSRGAQSLARARLLSKRKSSRRHKNPAAVEPEAGDFREGEWWIEDTGEEAQRQPLEMTTKAIVGGETADALDAAERSRVRALRLDAAAPHRARLLEKMERHISRSVVARAPPKTGGRRGCCCRLLRFTASC